MLKTLVDKLVCPVCESRRELRLSVFHEGEQGHVTNGILQCSNCPTWYPIQNDILEFLHPSLMYKDDKKEFVTRFTPELEQYGLFAKRDDAEATFPSQEQQRKHYDDFASSEQLSYDAFENLPFWRANDQWVAERWSKQQSNKTGWLLDVGCGNGRSAVRLSSPELTVIGIDISKNMVAKAIARAKEHGNYETRSFMVGDGNRLGFQSGTFDYAITSGVLSQLPDVQQTCNEIQRILKPNGIYFGLENNKSMFRGVFDALARIFAPWKNEKGTDEPEISREMLKKWHTKTKTEIRTTTSVYLPPVAFNLLGNKLALPFLKFTDGVFRLFGLKHHGGLIIFEVEKIRNE